MDGLTGMIIFGGFIVACMVVVVAVGKIMN